jgi:Domain of unknown function (DUF397)
MSNEHLNEDFAGQWRKSSFSAHNAGCVEVAPMPDGGIAMRDSKDRGSGPVLVYTSEEWHAFTGGVRNGEFSALEC